MEEYTDQEWDEVVAKIGEMVGNRPVMLNVAVNPWGVFRIDGGETERGLVANCMFSGVAQKHDLPVIVGLMGDLATDADSDDA